jgi:hypothetical protein
VADPYRILVTGSRDWTDEEILLGALAHAVVTGLRHHDHVVVVHGACRTGADAMTDRTCRVRGVSLERHPADWDAPCRPECEPGHRRPRQDGTTCCPAAGHYRNQEMADRGAHVCLSFFQPGSANRGTSDCVCRAIAAGITIRPFGAVPPSIKRLLATQQQAAFPGL